MATEQRLKSIELFAGAGGFALGVARAGFDHELVVENDDHACETIRLNRRAKLKHAKEWNLHDGDISEIDFTEYEDSIDLVCGGPPCQPFSMGGNRRGRKDERDMFPEAIRTIREVKPRAFVFENVRGLTSPKLARYFQYTLYQLEWPAVVRQPGEKWVSHLSRLEKHHTSGKGSEPSYNVVWAVLKANDFGIPQRRDRLFIVGVRRDLEIEYAFPNVTHSREQLLFDQWVSGNYWSWFQIPKNRRPKAPKLDKVKLERLCEQQSLEPWVTIRDAFEGLPSIQVGHTSRKVHNHFLNPGARAYGGHSGSPYDWPAKTLKAGRNGVPGGENTLLLDDGSIRYFSVRECARLQTFPDSWRFDGSWTRCMRQVGNAVPVELGRIVVQPLYDALAANA